MFKDQLMVAIARTPKDIQKRIYDFYTELHEQSKSLLSDIESFVSLRDCMARFHIQVFLTFIGCFQSSKYISKNLFDFWNRYPFRNLQTKEDLESMLSCYAKGGSNKIVSRRQCNTIYGLMTPKERYKFVWFCIR